MNKFLRNSQLFLKRNSSTILTCVGAVGVVATAITTAKATPKAIALVEKAKEEKGEDLTKMEVLYVAGPAYIPSVLVGASTIACIFGANVLNKRQQAALMSAYALLDNSYKEYKAKVEELYGEGADIHVRRELAKDKYDEQDISVGDDKELFYDEYSQRYFEAAREDVIQAQYDLNKLVSMQGGAYLNEYYEAVGLETTEYGDYLGWSEREMFDMQWNSWVDFDHEKVEMEDGMECTIISFRPDPTYDFLDY